MGEALRSIETEQNEYKPISGLAVAALFAGFFSAGALVTPFFWFVPFLGVGLASLGLTDVSRQGVQKIGRTAALCGLALSVGFGAQAISYSYVKRSVSASRAEEATRLWIAAMLDARVDDAREMSFLDEYPIKELAKQLSACDALVEPHIQIMDKGASDLRTWFVQVRMEPCDSERIELEVEVAHGKVARQGGLVERWMVVDVKPTST